MKPSRKVLITLAAVAALVTLIIFVTRPREPVYEGKRLSEWMEDLGGPYSVSSEQALRQIGTNAIPHLLYILRQKSSPGWMKVRRNLARVPVFRPRYEPIELTHERALLAMLALGPNAKPALPDLSRLLLTSNGGWSRPFSYEASEVRPDALAYVMAQLGPEAAPHS